MNVNNKYLNAIITINNDKVDISGNIINPELFNNSFIVASNPIDRMFNYSGSGLPFPSASIAFENTPNIFLINETGHFKTTFYYPNSYYDCNGKDKIVSAIFFILQDKNDEKIILKYVLKDLNPLRSLVNRKNRVSPEFYFLKENILQIDTQENMMKQYSIAKSKYDIA